MSDASPLDYRESIRKELRRRTEAITSLCEEMRAHGDSRESQARVHRLVSFMVKYVLSQPVAAREFRRLLNLDTAAFCSLEGHKLRKRLECVLRRAAKYMRSKLRSLPSHGHVVAEQPRPWSGLGYELSLPQMLRYVDKRLRAGPGTSDPTMWVDHYGRLCFDLLVQVRGILGLNSDPEVDRLGKEYERAKRDIEHLLGYQVDYGGGEAAKLLARVHLGMCPDEARGLYDNRAELLRLQFEKTYGSAQLSIEDIRNATTEVHALLDAFLDEHAAKHYLIERLAAYFLLYAGKRVQDGIDGLKSRQRKSPKIEEQVFRPMVEEFMFHHGYYVLSESQLGAGGLRPDILMQEKAAWFLFELKQCGFGNEQQVSATGIERKLREAVWKAERYHNLLTPLHGVQPDIYVICFVRGTAEFAGVDGALSGHGHDLSQAGVRFHLRIVNLPPSDVGDRRLLIRTASLTEASRQDAASRIAASGPLHGIRGIRH